MSLVGGERVCQARLLAGGSSLCGLRGTAAAVFAADICC